jgi:maltooligosyltrehalose trehalohydrolase
MLTGERGAFYTDFGEARDLVTALEQGFVYQGQPSRFRGKPHGTRTDGLLPRQFVFCLQNHDQVGNRPTGERLANLVPPEALEPLATLLLLGPGLPLLFMGEEHGETRPFLYFTSHTDPELARAVSEGRRNEFISRAAEVPDPQDEATFRRSRPAQEGKSGLRAHYRRMLEIRRQHRDRIGAEWPRVRHEGRAYTLERPGLTVRVNLGPEPALGMPGWGWEVSPR